MIFSARIITFLILALVVLINSTPLPNHVQERHQLLKTRLKRQIDLTLSAEHDDKEDETEIALEAIANLWRSTDGNTQIDGSAKVLHRSSSLQNGSGSDWRLGVRVLFT
ncbi:uncharacterized protein LOC135953629 [Calliphora vicina]|uniref:uncharacterized protein LOC135953629 n=1 Tax=Calliphora vicina TaxID=7373 RepID=UPI00325BD31E